MLTIAFIKDSLVKILKTFRCVNVPRTFNEAFKPYKCLCFSIM